MEENGRSGNTDRPDEEGIKTGYATREVIAFRNTDRPDEEGIKTARVRAPTPSAETQTDLMKKGLRRGQQQLINKPGRNTDRPDEEGIKTL